MYKFSANFVFTGDKSRICEGYRKDIEYYIIWIKIQYTGNIMIKSIEGTAIFMAHQLKAMFQKNLGTKIGYLLCKSGVNDFKKVLDSREVGGSMFLGVQKPVVKAHGSSDDYAMMSAIRQAKICVETGVCDAIAANMDKMTIPKTADEA